MNSEGITVYRDLLGDIKTRVRAAQHRAALSANAEMIGMYWDIGRMIAARQEIDGWGKGLLAKLAIDLRNELPEIKGFSERNLQLMVQFQDEYPGLFPIPQRPVAELGQSPDPGETLPPPVPQFPSTTPIVQQPAAQLTVIQRTLLSVSWAHNIILVQKLKDLPTRLWYARQAFEQGWSRDTLTLQIKNRAHERQGTAITNFATALPEAHAELAQGLLKDPYLFDFLTLCQTKDRVFAEYALRDLHKPIGIAGYELTRALPAELASSLPSIEDLEAELAGDLGKEDAP